MPPLTDLPGILGIRGIDAVNADFAISGQQQCSCFARVDLPEPLCPQDTDKTAPRIVRLISSRKIDGLINFYLNWLHSPDNNGKGEWLQSFSPYPTSSI